MNSSVHPKGFVILFLFRLFYYSPFNIMIIAVFKLI